MLRPQLPKAWTYIFHKKQEQQSVKQRKRFSQDIDKILTSSFM
jgi:hypothetical protein